MTTQVKKQQCLLCDRPACQDGGMLCDLCRRVIDTPAAAPTRH